MPNRNYLTFAHHEYLFKIGYNILQKNPDDHEVLAVTFEEGRRALRALDDLSEETRALPKNKSLAEKVYELSKEIKKKGITFEDAPYMFP